MRLNFLAVICCVLPLFAGGCDAGNIAPSKRDLLSLRPPGSVEERMAEGSARLRAEMVDAESSGTGAAALPEERKILRQASLLVEVERVEAATEAAKGIVVKIGGFVASSQASEDDAGRTSTFMALRVPSARLDEALGALRTLGHVRDEGIQGEDVTESYVDVESRLANAKRLEARLIQLLEQKTKELKDMLDAERELARVRETIETMEGKKRFLDNRISLSTIQLTLVAPPGWGRGIFDPLAGSLQRALSALTTSLAWLVVALAAALPWIITLLAMAWTALRLLRWRLKRKREAKAKKTVNGKT